MQDAPLGRLLWSGLLCLSMLVVPAVETAAVEKWIVVDPVAGVLAEAEQAPQAPTVTVDSYGDGMIDLTAGFYGVGLGYKQVGKDWYLEVTSPESPMTDEIGKPHLPVIRKLFTTPIGATVKVQVDDSASYIVSLEELGMDGEIAPVQHQNSLSPSALEEGDLTDTNIDVLKALYPDGLQRDVASYTTGESWPSDRVVVTPLAKFRGRQLQLVEIRPVSYRSYDASLVITPEMRVYISFSGGEESASHRPLAGFNNVVLNPDYSFPPRGADLGNYLIFAAEDFYGSDPLNEFVAFKTAQGYNVTVNEVPIGTPRPDVHAAIQALWGTPDEADYVLMVGDANEDQHYLATHNTVPPQQGGVLRWPVTDVPHVCMDGVDDWFPDIPVGRLPVRDVSSLQAVVDKIIYVEDGDYSDPTYTRRAVLSAGSDPEADADNLQDFIISTYLEPAEVETTRLYYYSGATTEDIVSSLDAGLFLYAYYGHSSGCHAWSAPAFLLSDIDTLSNANLYPYLLSFNCSSAAFYYDVPTCSPGWCERWLNVANKGASATYGTGLALDPYTWDTWRQLYLSLYRAMYADGIRELGPSSIAAKAYLVAYYGTDTVGHEWTDAFILFGDPSMRLPEPPAENYLIVSAQEYLGRPALNSFIQAKEAQGLNVMVYSADPGTSNADIKAYIQSLWGTADAPDYVLLVGDTDGFSATATTVPHWEGLGDHYGDTDLPYGCMDAGDDWYPEIPVGRFSVRDNATLQIMVDKTAKLEAGIFTNPDFASRGTFLANASTHGTAEPCHDYVIDTYFTPNEYEGVKIYASQGGTTQDVIDEVSAGSLFTVYYGHSTSSGWWEPAFNASNIQSLTNYGMPGVVLGWSCNTSHFSYTECFGETWVRADNIGAAAYISASDYIYWNSAEQWRPSVVMEQAFFSSLFDDNIWTLGDAWMATQYSFLTEYGLWDGNHANAPSYEPEICRNFIEEFVILGDPALRIPRPSGFSVSVLPEHLDVCAPDDGIYSVQVSATGSFADPVTLNAVGVPTGLTAEFSPNNEVPPFSSTLTLSDTDQGSAGLYPIQVVAESGGIERRVDVQMSLAEGMPGAFSMSLPADGAVDVSRAPTFQWTESQKATEYHLDVATDVNFFNIVYSADCTKTVHVLDSLLNGGGVYYWRVSASSGCGTTGFVDTFVFTVIDEADYFTELFVEGTDLFDLDYKTLFLTPDGSGDYYSSCIDDALLLPTNPEGGTAVTLVDDGNTYIEPSKGVSFYGSSYKGFYLHSNGHITFDGADSTYQESVDIHFARQRISVLFDDFNPEAGGTISWKETGDRVAITWSGVPQYNVGDSNTMQLELFDNGEIHITWYGMGSTDGIVGLSEGEGIPDDYVESDHSAAADCTPPIMGACCVDTVCEVLTEADCLSAKGTYQGDYTVCSPNPCVSYDSSCLIISEVVLGAESGACPRWVEITNSGDEEFVFGEGGLIVQTDGSSDMVVDVDLTGVSIDAGQSFVVNSFSQGTCTGAFNGIYGFPADMDTNVSFGFGDERFILTDTADASNIIDIYGEFGTDGTGTFWEFTKGYSYRQSEWCEPFGLEFSQDEWFFGGVDSLAGPGNPTTLLLTLTTPMSHDLDFACSGSPAGDLNDDGFVDLDDYFIFVNCLAGPDNPVPPKSCSPADFARADLERDYDVDLADFAKFSGLMAEE